MVYCETDELAIEGSNMVCCETDELAIEGSKQF